MIVDDPIISEYGSTLLLEWATHWSHTAEYQDFSIEVVDQDGEYNKVSCPQFAYKTPMEGLFGCSLDPSLLITERSVLG